MFDLAFQKSFLEKLLKDWVSILPFIDTATYVVGAIVALILLRHTLKNSNSGNWPNDASEGPDPDPEPDPDPDPTAPASGACGKTYIIRDKNGSVERTLRSIPGGRSAEDLIAVFERLARTLRSFLTGKGTVASVSAHPIDAKLAYEHRSLVDFLSDYSIESGVGKIQLSLPFGFAVSGTGKTTVTERLLREYGGRECYDTEVLTYPSCSGLAARYTLPGLAGGNGPVRFYSNPPSRFVEACTLDMGVSSMQIDAVPVQNGFSFSNSGPLDMRALSAAQLSDSRAYMFNDIFYKRGSEIAGCHAMTPQYLFGSEWLDVRSLRAGLAAAPSFITLAEVKAETTAQVMDARDANVVTLRNGAASGAPTGDASRTGESMSSVPAIFVLAGAKVKEWSRRATASMQFSNFWGCNKNALPI